MTHIPLNRAMLCIDCSTVFELVHHRQVCPACACHSMLSLARLLNPTGGTGEISYVKVPQHSPIEPRATSSEINDNDMGYCTAHKANTPHYRLDTCIEWRPDMELNKKLNEVCPTCLSAHRPHRNCINKHPNHWPNDCILCGNEWHNSLKNKGGSYLASTMITLLSTLL